MPQIIWNESFSVNIKEIDDQHKKWIDIFNNLHSNMIKGKAGQSDGLRALKAMEDYSRYHFSFEEEYMLKIGYPVLYEHRRLHVDFDDMIYSYYRKAIDGELILNSEILSILKGWILNHILKEDKQYAIYFEAQKKGV